MDTTAVNAPNSPNDGDNGANGMSGGQAITQSKGRTPDGDRPTGTSMATSMMNRPPAVLRKKLPWLEGRPHGAGLATAQRSQVSGGRECDVHVSRPPETGSKASIHPGGNDLSLRAIGSTPILRQNNIQVVSAAFSQSSQLPPGSKLSSMFVRRPQPTNVFNTGHVSSEYSATNSDGGYSGAHSSPTMSLESPGGSPKPDVAPIARQHGRTAMAYPKPDAVIRGTKRPKPKDDSFKAPNARRKGQRRSREDRIVPGRIRGARSEHHCKPIESSIYKPPATRPLPTKTAMLHKLPIHLVASSESSSTSDIHPAKTSPLTASSTRDYIRGSARRPDPILSTAGRTQPNEGSVPIDLAVTGHENLLKDTLSLARDATRKGRADDVTHLLNEATLALQQAESVSNILGQPLMLSPAASMRSLDTSHHNSSRDASSHASREALAETMPTVFTKSSMQPLLVRQTPNSDIPCRTKTAKVGSCFHPSRCALSSDESISSTPPRLYAAPSAESIIRDFAYGDSSRKPSARSELRARYGAAASFYGDHGESVVTQPGIRRSAALESKQLAQSSPEAYNNGYEALNDAMDPKQKPQTQMLRRMKGVPADALRSRRSLPPAAVNPDVHQQEASGGSHSACHYDTPAFMQPAYYRNSDNHARQRQINAQEPPYPVPEKNNIKASVSTGHPALLVSRNLSLKHPRRGHLSIAEDQGFSLGRYHKRQPIAREWNVKRKRLTAMVACLNTIFIGLIAGIYVSRTVFTVLNFYLTFSTGW